MMATTPPLLTNRALLCSLVHAQQPVSDTHELVRCEMFAREEIAACQRAVEAGTTPAKR